MLAQPTIPLLRRQPVGGATHPPMEDPTGLLLQAAARLNADGHIALASDLHQLARRWSPPEELVGSPLPMQQTIDLPIDPQVVQ